MVLSTLSSTSIEDVAAALSAAPGGGVFWLQLYIFKDRVRLPRVPNNAAGALGRRCMPIIGQFWDIGSDLCPLVTH